MTEVLVVHCVDTEGPLRESIEATFERLREIYGIRAEASAENLQLIQKQTATFVPPELKSLIATTFSESNLRYNSSWPEIDRMMEDYFSNEFRSRSLDDHGSPWKTTWFTMDHEVYQSNPREKTIGQGLIHQNYLKYLSRNQDFGDTIEYHAHPTAIDQNPVAAATSYTNSAPRFMSDLAMRLIEFGWFPSCFRPGFHSIRPDSNLWIEQWFPFDYSNQFHESADDQPDLANGRFGDWRRAPSTWGGYNPDLVDYQRPGRLRRTVFRCLNVGTRVRPLEYQHLRQAFGESTEKGSAVLAFTNHDFRDIRLDVLEVMRLLQLAKAEFPSVTVRYASASEAARLHLKLDSAVPKLKVSLSGNTLRVQIDPREAHSIQPFLAIETMDGRYLHDNFDQVDGEGSFSFTFDSQTIPISLVSRLGAAIVGKNGRVAVETMSPTAGS